jgi:hypothetical protein
MPKKTKKEKIIAEYKRKLSIVSASPNNTKSILAENISHSPPPTTHSFSLHQVEQKKAYSDSLSIDPKEFHAIKKDLIVTLGITICILIGQIVIWKFIG